MDIFKQLDIGLALGKIVYVVDILPEKNEVVIGSQEEILKTELTAENINLISISEIKEPMHVQAKIRYNSKESPAMVYPIKNNQIKVIFENPVRAVTPGQSVVFYDNDIVIGGGVSLLGNILFDEIRKSILKHSINIFADKTPVVQAKLKRDVGIFGAASIIMK